MGQISIAIPQTGQPDATEDPKVASGLTTLQTLVNGNLDTTNLSASAAITASQLAAGVILTPASSTISTGVTAGQMMVMSNGNTTATLPATGGLISGTVVGVRAGSTITGASPVVIVSNGAATNILVPGYASGLALVVMGTPHAFVTFLWDGTAWRVVSGGEDSGWVALTLGTNIVAGDNYIPSTRRVNGSITFKGTLQCSGPVASGTTIATVASGFRPPGTSATPLATLVNNASAPVPVLCAANGQITATGNLTVNQQIPLNRVGYELNA